MPRSPRNRLYKRALRTPVIGFVAARTTGHEEQEQRERQQEEKVRFRRLTVDVPLCVDIKEVEEIYAYIDVWYSTSMQSRWDRQAQDMPMMQVGH
ncbi:hypothetical protein Trydic_g1164 [Trypoxylus dichotomus]